MHDIYEIAMKQAIELAEKGRFFTAPNPCVGAVLVKDNAIVAIGYHHYYGQDHAEVDCIKDAKNKGIDTKGATIVVTLEPCNHTGKTPPCTKAILEAGITKVVIGLRDPHDIASGGIEFLQENNVEVLHGVLEEDCKILLRDYLVWVEKKRPYVILKMATSLDAKISLEQNKPYAITNEKSKHAVSELRANIGIANGAIMVGYNTFIADNPKLTARDVECEKQPKAIIVTSKLPNIHDSYYLLQKRISECIFLTSQAEIEVENAKELVANNAKIYCYDNLNDAFSTLYTNEKISYILCEGGAFLGTKLFVEELVDEYRQFIAPKMLHAINATHLLSSNNLFHQVQNFKLLDVNKYNDDIELVYKTIF